MKIKLSATFEGKCFVCRKKKIVFTAGDEDTRKAVTICKSCTDDLASKTTAEVIEKYGKKDDTSFKQGVRVEKHIAG